jgi:hypothetical protein
MGKQKLTPVEVKLIKHMHSHLKINQVQIAQTLGFISRPQINHIVRGVRWGEIETPSLEYGQELYYRFLDKGTVRRDE